MSLRRRARERLVHALFACALVACAALPAGPARAQTAQTAPTAEKVRVVVAGLPFRVHSAKPMGHLEGSLADLVASRLEASGRVEVLESVVVREAALGQVQGELSESAVKRLAQELGADYVITGSLTELAGRFSLDVRITPTSGGPGRSMVFTAESEDELLDRINELADRFVASVSAAARAPVAEVLFLGAGPNEESYRDRLATRVGDPYESARVRQDVAFLRSLPEVATASVDTQRDDLGVRVIFTVVPRERLLGAEMTEEAPDVVVDVRVSGEKRIEADAIRARISTRPGDLYRPTQVAADLREVHALGFFRDVRVLSEGVEGGRILTFEVVENPVVRRISIEGNENIGAEQVRDALTLTTGATLDYPLLYENRERVAALYRAEGYYLADVTHLVEELQGNAVGVHFEIAEGEKLKLREIAFKGNEHFDEGEVTKGFKTKRWRLWSYLTSYLDNSGTYAEPIFVQDLRGLEQRYLDEGYLEVDIGEPQVEAVEDGLSVTVPLSEGQQFSVGSIDVEGDSTVDLAALTELTELERGEVFNRSHLTEDVQTLTSFYTDRGFYFASINPLTKVNPSEQVVDIVFQVEKGPLYFVRDIEFAGNTNTVDSVLRREMGVVEGQLYSARSIQRSRNRIQGLGYFDEVNFEPQPTDYPGQLDLGVKVVEHPTGSLSFGAGFSSQESFVVTGSLSQSNLFGRGYATQLSADIGGETSRFVFSFADPRILDSEFSFRGSVFNTEVEFEDFRQSQTGIDLLLGHPLNLERNATGFLRYSYANREVTRDSAVNASAIIFRELLADSESTGILGLSFRADTRDDRLSPTKGWVLGGGVEVAGLLGFSQFVRFEGRISRYLRAPDWFPIFPGRSTFVASLRAGYTVPFNTIDDFDINDNFTGPELPQAAELQSLNHIDTDVRLPLTERYFLGGLGQFQLRGFEARSVGPRRAILRRTGAFGTGTRFTPVGRDQAADAETGEVRFVCVDGTEFFGNNQGDNDGKCNSLYDTAIDDFDDLDETDVIGGNKFLAVNLEYRFPISDSLGLMGIVFLDMGNAFAEDQSIFDIGEWRYGTGLGVQWFSPFGPLQAFWGVPLNGLSVEDSNVFEFSMGGQNF